MKFLLKCPSQKKSQASGPYINNSDNKNGKESKNMAFSDMHLQ